MFHKNGKDKKAGLAVLIANKIDFKTKAIVKDKEGHYIMIKRTIKKEDIILVNIYTPNIEAPNYMKQIMMDIKGEIYRNTVIVRNFNIPLTSMDKYYRQKINKESVVLNNTLDQMELIDIFRAFHPKVVEYAYHFMPCIMHTHIFGPNFQEKNLALKFFQFDYLFIYLYSSTCFWYFKRILAFIFEHIMVQEILCNK